MEETSTLHRQKSFPFQLLPAEVRQKIYSFAVTSAPPIELRINYHSSLTENVSVLSHVKAYTVLDFRMLATNHEFRKEMTDALYANNAFDIPLWREEIGTELHSHQIDLKRIRKCRLVIHNMETAEYYPHTDRCWSGSFPLYWHYHLRALMATLVFDGHQIESLLVECHDQNADWLLECLRPMAMLRRVGLAHFRSGSPKLYPYFGFLEAVTMSDRAVPFRDRQGFWDHTRPWRPRLNFLEGRRDPPPRSTDMTGEGVVKSEEEMEDMAKTLDRILEIER